MALGSKPKCISIPALSPTSCINLLSCLKLAIPSLPNMFNWERSYMPPVVVAGIK